MRLYSEVHCSHSLFHYLKCLAGLVVKASASGVEYLEFDSRLRRGDFSGSRHTSNFKTGSPVATLPGI